MTRMIGRFAALAGVALLVMSAFALPVSAQDYGEDPPETIVIGVGIASREGTFFARYSAPDEIAEGYLVYVVGTDEDGLPFEYVLANVTPAFAGLTWTLNGIDMLPGSEYTIEARFHPGTDVGTQVLGIQTLPTTGANSRGLVGLGLVLAVIGAALVYGVRMNLQRLPV